MIPCQINFGFVRMKLRPKKGWAALSHLFIIFFYYFQFFLCFETLNEDFILLYFSNILKAAISPFQRLGML